MAINFEAYIFGCVCVRAQHKVLWLIVSSEENLVFSFACEIPIF